MLKYLSIMRACAFCNAPSAEPMCDACAHLLPLNSTACRRCANPLAADGDTECGHCQVSPPAFVRAVAPLLYEFPVDMAIKALKFRRQLFYVPVFANLLLRAAQENFADVDAIVPVPLHRARQVMRGFNQARELGMRVAATLSLPIAGGVRRVRNTRSQSELHADERARNMRSAFRVIDRLEGKHVLIIDDVMTTGETCNELARTLLEAGTEEVSVLVIARASSPR